MRFSRVVLAAVAAGALAIGAAAPGQAASSPGWRQVLSKHYGSAADFSAYTAVTALAKNNAWAFGTTDYSGGTTPEAVAEHWNGKSWSAVSMPAGTAGDVLAASAVSSSNIWAVTFTGAYILHWNGARWSVSKHLTGFGELTGVTAISATNVWAFGGPGGDPGLGTWHFNGKTWAHITGGATGLENASAVSASNIWGIGSLSSPYDAVVHYNGKTWQHVTAAALSGLQFRTVKAFSATNIWVSAHGSGGSSAAYLVHYNGKVWTRYSLPWKLQLSGFASDGKGGVWLTGSTIGSSTSYAVHRSASGVWSRTALSAEVQALALTPGTTSVWGTGYKALATGANAVIWAYGTLP